MMRAVVGRALGAGALAGALSGAVAVVVFVIASAVHPGSGGLRVGELVGATINYLLLAVLIGAAAGAALAIPIGIVLALGHRRLTGQPARVRIATALLCALVVVAFGAALSVLGTATMYLGLLVIPALIVTPAVGAWRAMRIVDGPGGSEPAEPVTALLVPALGTGAPRPGHRHNPARANPAPANPAPANPAPAKATPARATPAKATQTGSDTVLVAVRSEELMPPESPTTAIRGHRGGAPPVIPDTTRRQDAAGGPVQRRELQPGGAPAPAVGAHSGPPVESGIAIPRTGRRRAADTGAPSEPPTGRRRVSDRGSPERARRASMVDAGTVPLEARSAQPGTDREQGVGGRRHRAPEPTPPIDTPPIDTPPIDTPPVVERPVTGRRRHAATEPEPHEFPSQRQASPIDSAPAAEPTNGHRHRAEEPASPPNDAPLLRPPTSRHAAAPDDPRNGAHRHDSTADSSTADSSTGHHRQAADEVPIPMVPAQRRHGPESPLAQQGGERRGPGADGPRRHRRRDDQAG